MKTGSRMTVTMYKAYVHRVNFIFSINQYSYLLLFYFLLFLLVLMAELTSNPIWVANKMQKRTTTGITIIVEDIRTETLANSIVANNLKVQNQRKPDPRKESKLQTIQNRNQISTKMDADKPNVNSFKRHRYYSMNSIRIVFSTVQIAIILRTYVEHQLKWKKISSFLCERKKWNKKQR